MRPGVQAGALYRYYPSKRALPDAMVADAGAGPPAPADGDWGDVLREAAVRMRRGRVAHRDGARLMATFAKPGPASRAAFERLVAPLRRAGASPEATAVGVDVLVCFVNVTLEEQSRAVAAGQPRDAAFRAGLEVIIGGIRATLPVRVSD